MNRIETIEKELNVSLPSEYTNFIIEFGFILNEQEIFGYVEGMDINNIPCVIGATREYKKNYPNIKEKEIVISFDDYQNMPIVLNENGEVFAVDFDSRSQIAQSFNQWRTML